MVIDKIVFGIVTVYFLSKQRVEDNWNLVRYKQCNKFLDSLTAYSPCCGVQHGWHHGEGYHLPRPEMVKRNVRGHMVPFHFVLPTGSLGSSIFEHENGGMKTSRMGAIVK